MVTLIRGDDIGCAALDMAVQARAVGCRQDGEAIRYVSCEASARLDQHRLRRQDESRVGKGCQCLLDQIASATARTNPAPHVRLEGFTNRMTSLSNGSPDHRRCERERGVLHAAWDLGRGGAARADGPAVARDPDNC